MKINCPSEYHLLPKKQKKITERVKDKFFLHSSDKKFKIEKVRDGIYPAIITINGFHTENENSSDEWTKQISTLYPENIWFQVKWDSKSIWDWTKLVYYGFQNYHNLPWTVALRNCEKASDLLHHTLASCPSTLECIFLGHSLGARMIINLLSKNNDKASSVKIIEVHLFGAAIANDNVLWEQTVGSVKHKIYNYYSFNDNVLRFIYKVASGGKNSSGTNEVKITNVENVDVTEFVDGHKLYIKNLEHCINRKNELYFS